MRGQFGLYPPSGGGLSVPSGSIAALSSAGYKFLSADSSNTGDDGNITTPSDLVFAAAANSKYSVRYYLFVTSAAQAVVRMKPSYPASVAKVYSGLSGPQSSGCAQVTQPPTNGTQLGQYIATQSGDFTLAEFIMYVETTTAGNISFAFSGANGATPTTIKAGSYCSIIKLA